MEQANDNFRKIIIASVNVTAKFNESSHKLFTDFVQYGWYINPSTNILDFLEVIDYIKSNNRDKINEFFINHLKKDYQILKKQALDNFIDKKTILEKGFSSFENMQYEFSILIFLSQIDSISKQVSGYRLFGREKKQAKTKNFVDKHYNKTSFQSAILQPLADYGEINKAEDSFVEGELNRHRVIHGEDINYGTELNAYKVLSLVFYLTTLVIKVADSKSIVQSL